MEEKDKEYDIEKDPYFKYVTKFEDLTKPSARIKDFFKKVGSKFNPARKIKTKQEKEELKQSFLSKLNALRARMGVPDIPEEEKKDTLFEVFEEDDAYTIIAQTVFEPLEESIIYSPFNNELAMNNSQECIFLDLTGRVESSKISKPAEFTEPYFSNGVYTIRIKKKPL